MAVRRPAGVVFVAALAWLGAVIQMVAGSLVIAASADVDVSAGEIALAWTMIAIGVFSFVVAFALFSGSAIARILVTASFFFSLVSAVVSLVAASAGPTAPVLSGIGALLGLVMLYTPRANAYFR
ncbi:hypothetical protein MN032_01270 [Agromyces atrinae]|uniref:hypothetical protein n=1 Tax=Agromyces atrinae TaxID=592376 RepID=UPI001F5852B7|nr:hypothetical protein [Agromyces atrinae]MCI2956306.1 hypothetical protein [Agromyces atrinae]